ncbi:carboxypeptidase-like regulatory domain-containing protein, partial [uncultured Aquimarina sp.]|uniref:carboxypeptidase-like regulatory domain-containing protein n=1 Tax=uncultured Aquimarina sp. TaxID=575652 RepID=UPI00260DDCE5
MNEKYTYLKLLRKCIPILLIMIGSGLSAQIDISGTVTSENGVPIPGANVMVKNTTNGATTDFDGLYTISVPDENSILIFSYVGFTDQEIKVGGEKNINVTLTASVESLEQIVVVGYGSRRKSDVTGSVSSVNSEELNAFPVLNAAQALQGRAAGVVVQSNNGGEPG